MNKTTLFKNLKDLGYPLFEVKKSPDANQTLAQVVKTQNPRLLEGFPLLLANSLEKHLFDFKKAQSYLNGPKEKKYFRNLVLMSLALYKYLSLKLFGLEKLFQSDYFNRNLFNKFLSCYRKKEDLPVAGKQLSSVRVTNTFKNYFRHAELDLKNYVEMKDEFDLEYGMSQLFSTKQKELFLKKLRGEKMTKTEREYFSRSVKKKVLALANSDLHKLAKRLVKE